MGNLRLHAEVNAPGMWKVLGFPMSDRYLRDIDFAPLSLAEMRDAARRYAISPTALSAAERDRFLSVVGRIVPNSPQLHNVYCWIELVFTRWLAGDVDSPPLPEPKVVWLWHRVEAMIREVAVANSMLASIEEPPAVGDETDDSPGTTLWAIYELSLFRALWRELAAGLTRDEIDRLANWGSRHARTPLETAIEVEPPG